MAKKPTATAEPNPAIEALKSSARSMDDVSEPSSRNTVTVACKLPNGLKLRLFELVDQSEMSPSGSKTVKVAREIGEPVIINGCAVPFGSSPGFTVVGGYALTIVDEEFWDKWVDQNKDSPMLRNRTLFAHAKENHVRSQVKEQVQEKVKSGLEPINPKDPPKVGIGLKGTPKIETYEAA